MASGKPGAFPFCPVRAHLLTTRKRAVVLPDGSRALSEGDAPAGSRPAGSTEAGGRHGIGYALPTAPLTASSFSALRQPRGAYAPLFSKRVLLGEKTLDKSLTGYNLYLILPGGRICLNGAAAILNEMRR